jgi:hypothetical protein
MSGKHENSPQGTPYASIISAAEEYASELDKKRLDALLAMMVAFPELRDGHSIGLDLARIAYAGFLLTGPVLLRVRGACSKCVPPDGFQEEVLLNWRMFVLDPEPRCRLVKGLTLPVPPLMKVSMDRLSNNPFPSAAEAGSVLEEVSNLILWVGRFDATGGEEMVNLATACLLPPAIGGMEHGV